MKLRIITPTLHGVADYSAAVGLIILPTLLNLGNSSGIAFWFSIITGLAIIVVSVLTNYKLGIVRAIPYQGHLAIDLLVAITFMILPFLFDLKGIDGYYYWINAAVIFLVVSLGESK